MSSENRRLCFAHLKSCKKAGKSIAGFSEMLTMLQAEVTATGLNYDELKLLLSVIKKTQLTTLQRASLIKCLIPETGISEDIVESIALWFVGNAMNIQVTPAIAAIHWLIGLMDYGLVDMKVINSFYDWFFQIMLKNQKLEPYVSRLVYLLAKPDDVTRRQVSRILSIQTLYVNPRKHLTAVLSLFKSYRPEDVPETIPSINIESAWKPIPEALKQDLQKASDRCNRGLSENLPTNFIWNPVGGTANSNPNKEMLIPMVNYIEIRSSITREEDTKSVFEVRSLEDLGKHQLSLELPCNSMSLLANEAGLHILTFACATYQSRFSYNLYNTLQNAFIYEVGKYSYAEREKLLAMTAELTRYVGQEIILVSRFLQSYLPAWNTRDHRESIFALIEWMTFPCFADIYNRILVPLRTMWECSTIEIKCEILRTLENMVTNLFIKAGLPETRYLERLNFFGGSQSFDFVEVLESLIKFIQDLIVSGLNAEAYNDILLSAALKFYEQVARLQERSDLPLFNIASISVIYAALLSQTMNNLSRVCSLLMKYRDINVKLREMGCRDLFKDKVETVDSYAEHIAKGLWYDELFSSSNDGYLSKYLKNTVLSDINNICPLDTLLNIRNHWAVLPYKFMLIDMGLAIQSKNDCLEVAKIYYPEVVKFMEIFRE